MTTDFAEAIRDLIEPLPFIDRLAGLVRPVTISEETDTGKRRKIFPVACGVSAKDCVTKGKYQDLVPDSSKKSVLYFEENGGSPFVGYVRGDFQFRSNLRLVGWLNLQKLGVSDCSWSAMAVLQILSKIPSVPFNLPPTYTRCTISSISEAEKLPSIFSKYTYDETVTQYLLFPYDYFALNIVIDYIVPRSCIDAIILDNPIDCPAV